MDAFLVEMLKWTASLSGIAAALMIAVNAGNRMTGYGFLVFLFSSVCWIASSLVDDENALALQNFVLLGINILGVYRYLFVKAR